MRAWWAVLACTGCVTVAADGKKVSRVIGELSPRAGVATIDEPATDGATGKGVALGGRLAVMARLHPRFAAGLGIDVSRSGHDTIVEGRSAAYWWLYLPVASTRVDLGRFALSSWGGYYLGSREITEPGCRFGDCFIASQDLHGGSCGTAALVGIRTEGVALEAGPYAQIYWAHAKEDDSRTDFDEEGMRVRSLAVGLALQLVFGAPAVSGR